MLNKGVGTRTYGLERSRNKVIVGEPVVGENKLRQIMDKRYISMAEF